MLATLFTAAEAGGGSPLSGVVADLVALFLGVAVAVAVRDLLAEAEAEAVAVFVAVAVAQSVALAEAEAEADADPPAESEELAESDPEAVDEGSVEDALAVAESVAVSVLESVAEAVAVAVPVSVFVAVGDADIDAVEVLHAVSARASDAAAAGKASTEPYTSVPAPSDNATAAVNRRGRVNAAVADVVSRISRSVTTPPGTAVGQADLVGDQPSNAGRFVEGGDP